MNALQIFKNDQFGEIRTVEENGTVLFCGKDIALALGYSDTKKAIVQHCQENGVAIYPLIDSMGREQQAKFINEGNVYRLITHSKLPAAEQFEHWVFDEVLPTIRRNGAYMTDDTLEQALARVRAERLELLHERHGHHDGSHLHYYGVVVQGSIPRRKEDKQCTRQSKETQRSSCTAEETA